jgi:hypothetical protein
VSAGSLVETVIALAGHHVAEAGAAESTFDRL